MAFALRTGKGQTRIGIEGERWSPGNTRRLAASLQWQEWPLPFYGIGDRTETSAREIFTPRGITATLTGQQRIRGAWYLTTGLTHVDQRITTDSTGTLRQTSPVGLRGGRSSELSLGLLSDTREHLFAPRGGHLVHVSYARADQTLWSDFSYGRLRLDARAYRPLAGQHVLAAQWLFVAVDGAAPFDRLALVGGSDILRGYALGRYRDRIVSALQTEYRSPMVHGVGAVLFGGAGVAAERLSSIGDRRLLPTYGVGLRAQIDRAQRTAVRADLGRGRDGASGLYIGFNQAF
jgi:outer membrane protein assembly factor BamA